MRPPPVVQQPNPLSPPRAQQEYSQNRPDSLYTSPSPYRYGAQDDGYGYSGRDGFDGSAAGSGYQNEAAVDFGDFDEAVKEQMIRMEEQLRRSLRESRESSRGERRYAEEQPYRADSLPEYHHPPRDTYRHEDYAQQHHGQEYQPQQRPPAQTSHGSEHVSPKRTSQPLDATLPWQKPPPDKRAIQARYRAELEQQMQMDKQLRAMAANSGQSVVPSPQQPSAPRQFSASHRQDRRPSYDEPGYYADNLDNDFRLQPPPRTRPSAPEATPPSYSWPQQPPREHVYHDEYERDRYLPEGDRSVEHNGVMPIPSEAGRRAELRQRQKAQADALAAQVKSNDPPFVLSSRCCSQHPELWAFVLVMPPSLLRRNCWRISNGAMRAISDAEAAETVSNTSGLTSACNLTHNLTHTHEHNHPWGRAFLTGLASKTSKRLLPANEPSGRIKAHCRSLTYVPHPQHCSACGAHQS